MGHRLEGRQRPRHNGTVAGGRAATRPLFLRRRADFSGFAPRKLVIRWPYDDHKRAIRRYEWRQRGHTSTAAWRVVTIVGTANGTIRGRSSPTAGRATGAGGQ